MGVVENLRDVADLVKKAGEIELYKKIVAAEDEVRDLTREKRRLEDEVEELRHALRFKEEVNFQAPFYYQKAGDQTPYCPRCWEADKRAVHVVVVADYGTGTSMGLPGVQGYVHDRKARRRSASSSWTPAWRVVSARGRRGANGVYRGRS
jgi:hypothetical protein